MYEGVNIRDGSIFDSRVNIGANVEGGNMVGWDSTENMKTILVSNTDSRVVDE